VNKPVKSPRIDASQLQSYADAGVSLIPLRPWNSHDDSGKPTGKLPLKGWRTNPYNAAKVIAKSVTTNRNTGWRVDDGWVALDFDPRHAFGDDELAGLLEKFGIGPATLPTMDSGGAGVHVYFRVPLGMKFRNTVPGFSAVEVKGVGRFVVCAGSIHPSGKMYRWREGCPPLANAPECPPELLQAIKRPEPAANFAADSARIAPEQLAQMLEVLPADGFNSNDTWEPVLMAAHHATGGAGLAEFIEWSTQDPAFGNHAAIIEGRWNSLDSDKAGGRTIGTLNKALADAGHPELMVRPSAAEDFEDNPIDESWLEGSDRAKDEFEAQPILKLNDVTSKNIDGLFRVVNLNGKMRVVWWARSALDPNVRTPQFWSITEFKTALINKFCIRSVKKTNAKGEETESTIRIPLSHYFLSNPRRYTFDGVVLNPEMNSDSPDAINLWRGYGFEENETGDWSLMREHIRAVIANGKADRYDYIIKWIAWALQNPDKPCEVALILKSATHGTGKGMVLRSIRKLFGAHAMQISKAGLLTGRFNAHLAMTCFLFVDEMTLADNKESATLNSTLTEDAIPIEPKGVDAYMMPNHVKVAAASNQKHVVLVAGSDRRFMVFEVSDAHARDIPYFKAMNDQLEQGGYGRMLHDLVAMDLGEWHPRETASCNDDKDPEKIESAPPELQWLAGYLDAGVLDCQAEHRGGATVYAGDFYERARKASRGLSGWTDNRFADFLKEWKCERRRSNGSQWVFPPLADMRAAFAARYPWWPAFDSSIDAWHDASVIVEDHAGVAVPADEFG
jgi:hypothetical protein